MSMGYRGKTTNLMRENVAVQAQAEREAAWGELTGTIVDFDPARQVATIQPDYRPMHNGEPIDMPQLQEVPVRFTRTGGFVISTPIKPGNKVTLRPQQRSSEEYHTGGQYESPNDARSNSLSDMEAFLDGGEPLTNPIGGFNSENMEIRTEGGLPKIEIGEGGTFIKLMVSESVYIELSGDGIKLVAPKIELNP